MHMPLAGKSSKHRNCFSGVSAPTREGGRWLLSYSSPHPLSTFQGVTKGPPASSDYLFGLGAISSST